MRCDKFLTQPTYFWEDVVTLNGHEDLSTILDTLIEDPKKLDDVKDILWRKLNETKTQSRKHIRPARAVADDEDYFDNVPV